MREKDFRDVRRVMKKKPIGTHKITFTDKEFAESVEKALARRIEEQIKARFNKAQETK